MALTDIPVLDALKRRMDWLGQRQSLLTQNIANANTPGYKPRDLVPVGFRELLNDSQFKVQPKVTQPNHIAVGGSRGPGTPQVERKNYESAPSGNAVVVEDQMAKSAQTQLEYNTVSNVMRKQWNMLRTALGKGA